MTVEPVYDEATGDLQDLQVVGGTQHRAGTWTGEEDFVEQDDGSYRHIYQDTDTDIDNDANLFQWEDYLTDYCEAYPNIEAAVQWAKNAPELPEGFAAEFDEAVDSKNLQRFNEMAEVLMDIYQSAQMDDFQEELGSDEEFYEQLDDETFNADLEELQNAEFSYDQAETMAEVATSYEQGSVEHAILSAGVDLAFGKADIQDVINGVVERYGEATAVAAYYRLKDLFG